ncbi:MAG: hypothetical protein EXR99_16220 [Gemmataceae bacterium]|nr:hypothetical protein [Gemmataceae bacterium]
MIRATLQFSLVISLGFLAAIKIQGQPGEGKPHGIVLRVQSIQQLVQNTLFLLESMGKLEEGRQIENVLKLMIGTKGLEGIHTEKPLGLYGQIGANIFDSDLVGLIPIADQPTFLALLDKLNLKAKKGKGEVYSMEIPNFPFPLFFRFQDGYLLITVRTEQGIKEGKGGPKDFFIGGKGNVIFFELNVASLPEDLAKNLVPQIELQLVEEKNRKVPGETPAQEKFRQDMSEFFLQSIVQLFTQGERVSLALDLDRKTGDIDVSMSLSGKKDSDLAKSIDKMGSLPSLGASLKGKNSVFHFGTTLQLPDYLKNDFLANFLETLQGDLAKEKDAGRKALMEKFLKAVTPSVAAGAIDLGLDVRAEQNGKFSFVAGLKVANGKGLEEVLRQMHKALPPMEQKNMQLDAFPLKNGTMAHKLLVPVPPMDVPLFGSGPLFLAILDNKVLLSGGANGKEALEEVAARPLGKSQALEFSMALNAGAPLLAKGIANAESLAQKAFAKSPKADTWEIKASGGKELSLKMNLKSPVLKFMSLSGGGKK